MDKYKVYWGDLHTHFQNIEIGDYLLNEAKKNIDFCVVLCYPFFWIDKYGLSIETVRQREEFLRIWERLKELSKSHYEKGKFTTFLGYEWHGNRTYYGDHNVIYFSEDNPLDDSWDLPTLYKNMSKRKAFVIPHHTAYLKNNRSKDWRFFDERMSPVTEIFSSHGCSESIDTPYPLMNADMGPGVSGGTLIDGLNKRYRIGVIGSNDGEGLPGRWGLGRAAVLAKECTRESIWEAISNRRTYATTGDRIIVDFDINGYKMGSVIREKLNKVDVSFWIKGGYAIDRVELIKNGYVYDTYIHSGKWEKEFSSDKFKVKFDVGWGSNFVEKNMWDINIQIRNGIFESIEKCFTLPGQKILFNKKSIIAQLTTNTKGQFGDRQGFIVEIKGSPLTELSVKIGGIRIKKKIKELLKNSFLFPMIKEAEKKIKENFGIDKFLAGNPDVFFHNARKIKIHRAIPEEGYTIAHSFENVKIEKHHSYMYLRIYQLNGQMAWTSPIWVNKKG